MNIIIARKNQITSKFKVNIDGKPRWVYFYGPAFEVIKLDGEHTYLWYRDPRIDQEKDITIL